MSVQRVYWLFCDTCGARHWTAARTATSTRQLARAHGWRTRVEPRHQGSARMVDLCGGCAQVGTSVRR